MPIRLTLRLEHLVDGISSGRDSTGGPDGGFQLLWGSQLTVFGAGRPGDVLIHEGPAHIVAAGRQQAPPAFQAELDPGSLDVVDEAVEGDAGHGMNQHDLIPGRAGPGPAPQVDRALPCARTGSGTNSVIPPVRR